MQEIQWQDRFNIGVEVVDQAHRKLFAIVQKITELYVERHESKFACVEGIKYFKAYALQHFAQEEAYMREIGYSGYLTHKRLHDRMRRETLPALERELYATNFSTEAVQRFIGVCIGWLTGHIMIEDRAITGKTAMAPDLPEAGDASSAIHSLVVYPLQEILGLGVQYLGEYSAEEKMVDAQYYEITCRIRQNQSVRLLLMIGEQPLLRAAGLMFGLEFYALNEIARFAIREIAQNLLQRAAAHFGLDSEAYQIERDRFLEPGEYAREWGGRIPWYSLLFSVQQDCFALCIDQLPQGAPPGP